MKSSYLILTLLLLSSCVTVHFNEPQPKGGERLYTVPEELHGKWRDMDEGNEINKFGLIESDLVYDDSLAEFHDEYVVVDTSYEYIYLNDSIRLYKAKDYYVYNYLEDWGWTVLVIDKDDQGNLNFYAPNNFTALSKFRGLKVDSVQLQSLNRYDELEYKMIVKPDFDNMREDQIEDVIDVYVSGQIKKRDIKKLIRHENFIQSYRIDGTVFTPSDTTNTLEEGD